MRDWLSAPHLLIETVLGVVTLYNLVSGALHRHLISPKVEQALVKADTALSNLQAQGAAQQFVAPLLSELHDIKEIIRPKGTTP